MFKKIIITYERPQLFCEVAMAMVGYWIKGFLCLQQWENLEYAITTDKRGYPHNIFLISQ